MLHVTFWAAAVVLIEVGLKLKSVKLGGVVSHAARTAADPPAKTKKQATTATRRLMIRDLHDPGTAAPQGRRGARAHADRARLSPERNAPVAPEIRTESPAVKTLLWLAGAYLYSKRPAD